jgi:hypothetical protein
VHSVSTADFYDDLAFNFDANAGLYRIAYNYERDESDTKQTGARPNIRVLQFSTSPDGAKTNIDQTLPLEVHKIYRYSGNSTSGRGIIGLDLTGSSLVFGFEEGFATGTKRNPSNDWFDSIQVIEDINDCISNQGPEPDDRCATLAFAQAANLVALLPTWGLDSNRIYFLYDSTAPRDSDVAVGIIDRVQGQWTAPGSLQKSSEGGPESGQGRAGLWDQGNSGPREVVSWTVNSKLEISAVDGNCTAAGAVTSSCWANAQVVRVLEDPDQTVEGRWTTHITIDSNPPNLLILRDNAIWEYDPDSTVEAVILENLPGNTWFDPVD